MFSFHSCVGQWKLAVFMNQSDSISPIPGIGLIWLIPPSTSVIVQTIGGSISSGAKNRFRDRECRHYAGDGNLYYVGANNIALSTSNPFPDRPEYSSTVHNLFYRDSYGPGTYRLMGPVFVGNFTSYAEVVPDHTRNGVKYRNISFDARPESDYMVLKFQFDSNSGSSWIHSEFISRIQFDSANARYRVRRTNGEWWNWDPVKSFANVTGAAPTPSVRIPDDWERIVGKLRPLFQFDEYAAFGELAIRCADDARSIDVNSIEYLRDLASVVEEAKATYSLLKGKVNLKNISSLYLSYKYGMRLTYQDTKTIARDIGFLASRHGQSDAHARAASSHTETVAGITCNSSLHYKIYYSPHSSEFLRGIATLQSTGLFPTPKTVWELIPFSFVVDWFVNVSDRLAQQDADLTWSTHTVLGTVKTTKRVYTGIPLSYLGLSGCAGNFSIRTYHRTTPGFCVLPQYFSDTPREFKNYVELSALLLQVKKKR